MNEFFRRLGYLFSRSRRSRELADEMAFHREMVQRAGRPPHSFGSSSALREQAREAWGWTWIDRFGQDLRYAIRMLARSPGFTVSAVLVLAIGIGSNIFIFSACNLLYFKFLPVRDPSSLLRLQRRWPGGFAGYMPYPTAMFYHDHSKTLSAVLVMTDGRDGRLDLQGDSDPVRVNFISADYFRELGTTPAWGRMLDPARDAAPDAPLVAVVGYEFWRRFYHSDPNVVGKTVVLNHKPVTVAGVTPKEFPGLGGDMGEACFWIPIRQQPAIVDGSDILTGRTTDNVTVWARLAPGATAEMAQQELAALTQELRKRYPNEIAKGEFVQCDPGGHWQILDARDNRGIAIVTALALLMLSVACANLGGLLLARGVAREHEIGIRIAIGASRKRIFRQLFTESLLLAIFGSLAGLALSSVGLHAFLNFVPNHGWMTAAPDWRVFAAVAALACFTAILFGFTPALQMARQQNRRTLARQMLIAAQVIASCILVVNASLLVRSAQHLVYDDPGVGYEQVVSIVPALTSHGYMAPAADAYFKRLEDRLRAVPGLVSVSLVQSIPLGNRNYSRVLEIDGRRIKVYDNWVQPDFFRTMDVSIVLGRSFLPGEKKVVIVSRSLARREWPGQDPLGKLDLDRRVVVGVVADVHMHLWEEDSSAEVYFPAQAEDMPGMSLVLKTDGAPENLLPQLRAIAQSIDSRIFPEISLLKAEWRREQNAMEQLAFLFSVLGLVAMALAGIGILGLVSYAVSQRTREIAIRLALGSPATRAISVVLQQFRAPILVGLVGGAGCAVGLSRLLRSNLHGVSNVDPASYAAALLLMLTAFTVAALLPARRILGLDIARTLHEE